jgi:NPCBM/NEW2 domain
MVRCGEGGASADFERMLAQLVVRVEGSEAHRVWAHPGDWGIDVLVGDLNGRVRVWQAKYFPTGLGRVQRRQVESSFESAMRAAARHGYQVERWTLCVPSSMDGETAQWWQRWRAARQAEFGVSIVLWDETALRELLVRAEVADLRRDYYDPYHPAADPNPHAAGPPRSARARRWRGRRARVAGLLAALAIIAGTTATAIQYVAASRAGTDLPAAPASGLWLTELTPRSVDGFTTGKPGRTDLRGVPIAPAITFPCCQPGKNLYTVPPSRRSFTVRIGAKNVNAHFEVLLDGRQGLSQPVTGGSPLEAITCDVSSTTNLALHVTFSDQQRGGQGLAVWGQPALSATPAPQAGTCVPANGT